MTHPLELCVISSAYASRSEKPKRIGKRRQAARRHTEDDAVLGGLQLVANYWSPLSEDDASAQRGNRDVVVRHGVRKR